jgi:hypothetical protein
MASTEPSADAAGAGSPTGSWGDASNVLLETPYWQPRSAYYRIVRALRPAGHFEERTAELAELADFHPGREQYVWYQGVAAAGKTALLSRLATAPPPQTEVVSFFVTGRLPGQSDSDAFLDAMIDQLSAMLDEPVFGALGLSVRQHHFDALLHEAGRRLGRNGKHLILVVDGLDEDSGADGGTRPSIASLLPHSLPRGLKVVVASRPEFQIPADVSSDHPLRRCAVQDLDPSSEGIQHLRMARESLADLLSREKAARNVLGILVAAGGALDVDDLETLAGPPANQLEVVLRRAQDRSVVLRDGTMLFAHETLRRFTEDRLGPARVGIFRRRIHSWAQEYGRLSWPTTTPRYLLDQYPRLLWQMGDRVRATALAGSEDRHSRLLDTVAGQAQSLAEIRTAYRLMLQSEHPDLTRAADLALFRQRILRVGAAAPATLPSVWARLGHTYRAETLARAIDDIEQRDEALTTLSAAALELGHLDRVAAIAQTIDDDRSRQRVVVALAAKLLGTGNLIQTRALIQLIESPDQRDQAAGALVGVAVDSGDLDRAAEVVEWIEDSTIRAPLLLELADAASDAGADEKAHSLLVRAGSIVESLENPYLQARLLHRLRNEDAGSGIFQSDVMRRWLKVQGSTPSGQSEPPLANLVRILHDLAGPDLDRLFPVLARAAALSGSWDVARQLASRPQSPSRRAELYARLIGAGDTDSSTLAAGVEAANTIADLRSRTSMLADIARALSQAGDSTRAAEIAMQAVMTAHEVMGERERTAALSRAALAALDVGEFELAERSSRHITEAGRMVDLMTAIAGRTEEPVRAARLMADAELMIHSLGTAPDRAAALARLADVMVRWGRVETAQRLATEAEQATRSWVGPTRRTTELSALATALLAAEHEDLADQLRYQAYTDAGRIQNPHRRLMLLAELGPPLSIVDHAETLLGLVQPLELASARTAFARMLARSGQASRAEAAARAIADPYLRCLALSEVGALDSAVEAAQLISDHGRRTHGLAMVTAQLLTSHRIAEATALLGDNLTDLRAMLPPVLSAWAPSVARIRGAFATARLADVVDEPYHRALILTAALSAAAGEGDTALRARLQVDAQEAAALIADSNEQTSARTALATALVKAGDAHAAEAVARAIDDPDGSAVVLARLAQFSGGEQAARYAAEALAIGDWTIAMPVVGALSSDVAYAFTLRYLGSHYRGPATIETPAGRLLRYAVSTRDFVLLDDTSGDRTISWTATCDAIIFLELVHQLVAGLPRTPLIVAVGGRRLRGNADKVLAQATQFDDDALMSGCDFIRADLPALSVAFHRMPHGAEPSAGTQGAVIISAVLTDRPAAQLGWLAGRTASTAEVASTVARLAPIPELDEE